MGVDFYNCHICGEIYAGSGGWCEGCGKSWCRICDEAGKCEPFWFGDEIHCDLCFYTDPPKITDAILLEFALKKLKRTRSQLKEDLKSAEPKYTRPESEYFCHDMEDDVEGHFCGNEKCENISVLETDEEKKKRKYSTYYRKGVCCVNDDTTAPDTWCWACQEAQPNKKAKI